MNKTGLILCITGVMLGSSCGILRKKKVPHSGARQPISEKVLQDVQNAAFAPDWFSARIKVQVEQGKQSIGLKGQIRMRKDSALWISLTYLAGIEVARAYITPDSIMALNRLQNQYMVLSAAEFTDRFGLPGDFALLQDMIWGNYPKRLLPGTQVLPDSNGFKLRSTMEDQVWTTEIPAHLLRPANTLTQNILTGEGFLASYLWGPDGYGRAPEQFTVVGIQTDSPFTMEMTFSGISTEGPLNFSFRIPESYNLVR